MGGFEPTSKLISMKRQNQTLPNPKALWSYINYCTYYIRLSLSMVFVFDINISVLIKKSKKLLAPINGISTFREIVFLQKEQEINL